MPCVQSVSYPWRSHPIHPSTVHFPIAFLSLAYGLDTLYGLTTHYDISALRAVVPHLAEISRTAYFSNLIGIVTAIPAALTGISELYAMISAKGIWQKIRNESTGETVYAGMNPTVRHGLAHGALNDVALLASVYNWWTRRNVPGYTPSGLNVLLSMALLPSLMFSAYLGGAMVYKYGVGVMRMGEAVKIKKDMERDEVRKTEGQTQYLERKDQ